MQTSISTIDVDDFVAVQCERVAHWAERRCFGGQMSDREPCAFLGTKAKRTKGFFVSFDYSRDALTEIDAFFRKTGGVIIPPPCAKLSTSRSRASLA